MKDARKDVSEIVDAMARMLGMELAEDSREMVIMHLAIAFDMVPAFLDFPLPDEAEPAAIYTP